MDSSEWLMTIWQFYPDETEGLPLPVTEYRFHPTRRWRFDLAWVDQKLAVEFEGGTWVFGRHNRPAGYEADVIKYNAALLLGWRVLRFTSGMVNGDPREVVQTIRQALQGVNDGH